MNESKELAAYVAALQYTDLPKDVIKKAENLVLDQLGIELACATMSTGRAVYREAMNAGGNPQSTVVYFGDKLPVPAAAFVNACFGHGFETDDIYGPGGGHPGCVVVPSALALGEREHISGKEFILAIAAGYEIMGRAGSACSPSIMAHGHHPTSASGPFGSAAAAAKILGFDATMTLNALGIAGSTSCGISEFNQTGGTVKRIHGGLAASGGLRAAFLTKEGITGPPTVLEGNRGFVHAFSDGSRKNLLTANLGKSWVVLGAGYKVHSCCGANHGPIDCLTKIMAEHPFKAEDIDEMVIKHAGYAVAWIGTIHEPVSVAEAQFSGYFNLAMTAVMGNNNFRNYTDEALKNPKIKALSKKIRFEVDPEADAAYPQKRISGIEVKLKNGKTYSERNYGARGLPDNPITDKEVKAKFRDLSSLVLPKEQVEAIVKTVGSLEDVADVSVLADLLCRKNNR